MTHQRSKLSVAILTAMLLTSFACSRNKTIHRDVLHQTVSTRSQPAGAVTVQAVTAPIPAENGAQVTKTSSTNDRGVSAEINRTTGGSVEGTATYVADRRRRWRYVRYFVDRKSGHLAEAVVALSGSLFDGGRLKTSTESAKPRTFEMAQKDFRFIPETMAIRTGDRVKFTNADLSLHNVFASAGSPARFDVNLRRGDENVQRFDRAGGTNKPVWLRCVFHGSMQAWIFVFDHPYYSLTAQDGQFRFDSVPPGKYQLEMFHPAGELRFVRTIEVGDGKTARFDIRVSPDNKVQLEQQ